MSEQRIHFLAVHQNLNPLHFGKLGQRIDDRRHRQDLGRRTTKATLHQFGGKIDSRHPVAHHYALHFGRFGNHRDQIAAARPVGHGFQRLLHQLGPRLQLINLCHQVARIMRTKIHFDRHRLNDSRFYRRNRFYWRNRHTVRGWRDFPGLFRRTTGQQTDRKQTGEYCANQLAFHHRPPRIFAAWPKK